MKKDFVKDWMTTDVISISPDMSLPEAHEMMKGKKLRRLPVVEKGKLTGIVTLSDILEAQPSDASSLSIYEMNYLLAKLKVKKLMTKKPISIKPDATLSEAAQIMLEKKIGGIPVMDKKGRLSGIITESDIFRRVAQGWNS